MRLDWPVIFVIALFVAGALWVNHWLCDGDVRCMISDRRVYVIGEPK